MPAQEVGALYAIKWIGGIAATLIAALFGWLFKKANNTYTKEETEHLIDLKLTPLRESLDRSVEVNKDQTIALEKLTDAIQALHTSVVVVETEVKNLKNN